MQTPPHGHYRTYGWVCIERCFLNWVSVIRSAVSKMLWFVHFYVNINFYFVHTRILAEPKCTSGLNKVGFNATIHGWPRKFHQPTFFQVRWGTFSSGDQNFPEYFCEFCRPQSSIFWQKSSFFANKLKHWSIFLNFSSFQNVGRKKAGTGFLGSHFFPTLASDDVTWKAAASLLLGGNVLLCISRCLWLLLLLLINWVLPLIYLFIYEIYLLISHSLSHKIYPLPTPLCPLVIYAFS